MLVKGAATAVLLLALLPAPAASEWLFTPAAGITFGADTHGREHRAFGASMTWLDEDAFGFEVDLFFTPGFFEGQYDDFFFAGDSSVLGVMANVIVGAPGDRRLRPYFTGGIGVMQMHVVSTGTELFESTTREPGWNAGGGVMALLTGRIGLRGDLRYVRSFQDQPPSWTRGIDFDVAPGHFDFLRGMLGVTIRLPD